MAQAMDWPSQTALEGREGEAEEAHNLALKIKPLFSALYPDLYL